MQQLEHSDSARPEVQQEQHKECHGEPAGKILTVLGEVIWPAVIVHALLLVSNLTITKMMIVADCWHIID